MKCINHNSSEYKALNEVVSNKLLLDVLINRWQEVNRSDDFPSVKETKAFADKYNLNADTTKAAPTNIVDAKKAIGIKNPGYGYSDLQKNMLLKRLKAYNLKYNTKHSVNVEKVGQANLYKITFDYKSQSRLNFGSGEQLEIAFKKRNEVDFTLKAITILQSDKAKQVFAKGEKAKWSLDKILTELQVPKDQKQLILDLGITNREQIALELASSYSYTVEINTAKENKETPYTLYKKIGEKYVVFNVADEQLDSFDNKEDAIKKVKEYNYLNTQHYSNLTVPGGINYTEQEISTPLITPSIKGHAQFATDKGIGWFRSDEQLKGTKLEFDVDPEISQYFKTEEDYESIGALKERGILTKTRRILEVQSDLFQKGRDKADLILPQNEDNVYNAKKEDSTEEEFWIAKEKGKPVVLYNNTFYEYNGYYYDFLWFSDKYYKIEKNSKIDTSENQFLQLLNKDNNWVTFFVKSIIQDSAKKGYEKVLFPSGNTASKVEGHTTLEQFKKEKEDRIKELEEQNKPNREVFNEDGSKFEEPSFLTKERIENNNKEINQLKQELERVEKEGFGALKPIYNFYENTVTSILKKIYGKENVRQVTDEYGNTWNEVTIDTARDLKDIQLKSRTAVNQVNQQLSEEAFREIADKLSKKTGIKYNIEDPQTVYDYMVQEGFNMKDITLDNVPAFYYKGSIVFPTDYLEAETAFHEFAHPFVDAILKNNKQLFQTLKTQLQTSVVGRALIAEVKVDSGQETLDEHGWKEVITQALGKLADGSITQVKDKSLWNSLTTLLKNIAEYLQKLFTSTNKTVEPFDLKASTTLEALAKMLKTDATINVGKASVLFQEAEKMAIYGITSNQGRKTIPLINAALYRSITPATYSSKKILKKAAFSLFTGRSYEDFKDTLKEWISVDKASIPQWALDLTEEQYNKRDDAWRLSNGLPQKHNTFKYIGRGRIVNGKLIEDINGEDIYDFNNPVFKPGELSKINAGVDNSNFVMGNFAIKVGKDQYGFYTEYHDRWDLDLINKYFQSIINVTQTPFIVSGKMYHAATIDENGDIIYYYTQDATSSDVKYYNNITEELNTELPSDTIPQFKKRDTADSTQPTTGVKPTDFTNYHGGAKKYDTYWEQEGKTFGVTKHTVYTVDSYDKLDQATKDKLDAKYDAARTWLGRSSLSKDTYAGKLVRRDMMQAAKADGIFAVSEIVAPGIKGRKGYVNKTSHPIIEGGTGYAVASGILLGKPVYVFNQDSNYGYDTGWYKWDSTTNNFVKTDTPVLTKNYAGIGSSTNETEIGTQAIRDVYANTFKPTQPSTSVKPKGTINVYWGQAESATSTKILSNLAPRKFTWKGKEYGSVEHAYQTLKSGTFDQTTYDAYVKAGGYGTKIRGKAVTQGFDNLQLIKDLVVESFKQNSNSEAAKKLLQYENFTHNTNEIIDKAFLEGLKLAQQTLLSTQSTTNIKPIIDLSREWSGDLKTRPVYTPEGVNTMRTESAKPNEHFGNPFSASGYSNTIKVDSIDEAVDAYKTWLLTEEDIYSPFYEKYLSNINGSRYNEILAQRQWILNQINQGKLDSATLLYAGKLAARGEGMHPTALAEVVDQLRTTKPTTSVKPGVEELFDSNPELANAVYEALGFKQNNVEEFQGFWNRQQVASQTDKIFLFGDNTNDRTVTKYVPSMTQAVIRGLSNAIGIDTKKDRGTSQNSYLTDNDFDWFKNHVDTQIQLAKNSGKTIVIPADGIGTGKAMLKEKAPKLFTYLQQELNKLKESKITSQQKQQAQQQYSQYLDRIFPDSKVKDIVYHRTNSTIDNFDRSKTRSNAFYFNLNNNKGDFKNLLSVIINVKKYAALPTNYTSLLGKKNADITEEDLKTQGYDSAISFKSLNGFVDINKDATISLTKDITEETNLLEENLNKSDSDEYVVFKPEQIYILGGKQDIEGFKEFVTQSSTAIEPTSEETFTQDQLKTITEQLAYVVLSKVDTLDSSTEVDYSIIDKLLESLDARALDDEDLDLSGRISNVVDNLDMFKERVKTYIKDFGFTESEDSREDEDGNIVPINVLNVSDLKDAPSRVKLLVALLPSQDRSNSYLGLPKMVNFQEAWNDLKYAIADLPSTHPDGDVVDGLEAIGGKLYELSKYKPHFRILADKLISQSTSDQLRTQFYNTFTGTKINYSTTLINKKDGQMSVKIIDSDVQASEKLIRNEWNANFVDNIGIYDQMTLFHKAEEVKIVKDLANEFSVSIKKDIKSKTVSKESLSKFKQLLNKIGVTISIDALNSAIEAQNKESEALNLYSLMFDPKLGLYNGIKAIVDKSGQPFFTKNKTFRSEILNQDAFLELAKHEAKFRSDLGQSQILGPDGNAFGLFSKHNALTLILSDYKSNPEALKALDNSSYTKNTRWGKWMLKDKANAQAFNIVVLNNYKQEEGGDKGTSPSELKPGDTLTNVVNRTLKGNYIGLAEADKNNQYTFVGPKPEDSHVRGDLAYMYLENDNAVDVLMGYLEDEINRISDVHEQLFGENKLDVDKQIQYYHYAEFKGDNKANGLKLYILPELDLASFGLLYNSGKPMPLTSDNFHNNKELREYVKNAFLDAVKADVSTLIEVGVINSDFTNNSIDSAIINKHSHAYGVFNAVGDFTLNSIIANVEQTKLFNCDPAMYKTDKLGNLFTDISKRVPATSAQGTSAMVYSDSLGNEVVKATYTSAVIANIKAPSKYFINEEGNVKPEIIDDIYKAINSDLNSPKVSKESIETSLNGYKDVNRTDAQAWITIDLYRQRLLSFGQWDMKVHEPIFEDIKAGRPITAENMLFFAQPLKTVHVERKFQDGMFVLHYNKQSEAVLHPFLVKDIKLNNILEAMTASGTDHVITLDGKKVGASGIVAIADKKGNIFNSEDIKLNPVTLSTRCVLLQQDLKSKGVKQTLVASQAPKVTFSDVQLSENYIVDGEQLTGEQAVIALHDVTSELSNMGFEELKSELQVDSEGYVNDEAFRARLIKDLEDSDASSNVLDALREGLPIDAIPGLNITAQSKAMAMTRTAAVKLKQLGASLIQMSDFGFTGVAGSDVNTSIIWFKDPSTELVPTRLEKGKIRPSQVLLPYNLVSKIPGWKSMTPEQLKEAIDPECLKGFSYRIPNQGHSSNDVFEIAGILPESCGDVMIAYGEITKKTGSDFDIDKNYIILPNVEFDKASGKLRKIKYNPNRSKNDPFYKAALENRRLDLMSGLLGDPKTYLSNVSPLDNPWLVDLCAELFPATSTNTNLAFFTGTYQANIKLLYDNAKSLVGVVANQLSDHGVAQLDNLLLNTNLGRGVIDKPNGVNRLSPITGETGVLISIILNAYANGILDAAKDPYITRANINQQTAPVAFMLIRAGVNPNWVVSFIGQPIIKKLISETAKSESSIYVKKRNKEGKIITPIDVVLDGDKLPEDKNWNITLDDLNNNLKNEYHSSNDVDLSILSLFLKYQKIAKTLSASIRASKQDVNGGGKSLNYARALNNDLVNIINSNQILNLDKKIGVLTEDGEVVLEDGLPVMTGSRMVSTYHENSVNKSIVMFSNMFISQSPAFISALNSVLIMQGIEFSTFNIELIDKISNSVYSYLLSHPSSGISREDYNSLFFGNNSIAVRLKNIKNLKAKLAANLLIENMKYDIAYTTTDPSFVGLNNAKQLSKQSKDSLYLAWKELAKEDKKLALDLITYSYYASGFTKTLTSFHEHIPVSLLKELGFTDFIKGISKDVYDASFLYKAANQVIKNLHASTELVPKLPFVDPYGSMSTDYIFVLGDKLKDQYKISDITEEHAEHKRFVKYRNRFYKLAGYTTLNDNPVYVRTNTLGFNERGNTIKEYFFDDASNTSIIPNNNVSLPVDIAAIIGDPTKITLPTVVTKLKTIARTSQKTNLSEAEIEKIAKQKLKDC